MPLDSGRAITEHAQSLRKLTPIDEDHLANAAGIIKMLDGTKAIDDEKRAAARIADIYADLAGLKP